MAADPTEGAREDTDRVAAMEAARAMAVDRVEVRETRDVTTDFYFWNF